MLILLPLPSSLQRVDDGAIVIDLTVHVVLSADACLSSDCDAALNAVATAAVDGVAVVFPTDTFVSSCFGSCVPLAFNVADAAGAGAGDAATVVIVVAVTASTLFTDDFLCNRNRNNKKRITSGNTAQFEISSENLYVENFSHINPMCFFCVKVWQSKLPARHLLMSSSFY